MFIRPLTKSDHQDVVELFGDNMSNYYFLIDGLVKNNYEGNFKVFGEYESRTLVSILVNNGKNITYYSNLDRDVEIYMEILKNLSFSKLSGPSKLMGKFKPYLNVIEDMRSFLGVVKEVSIERTHSSLPIHTIKTKEEIGKQYDLLLTSEEYVGVLTDNRDQYIEEEMRRLANSSDRIVFLELNNEMVSSCATFAEDKHSAIVIGVVTNPKYRNQRYGTEVLIGLFEGLLKEGKYPYLFYNNPAARSVYKRIGMTEVCEWSVMIVDHFNKISEV